MIAKVFGHLSLRITAFGKIKFAIGSRVSILTNTIHEIMTVGRWQGLVGPLIGMRIKAKMTSPLAIAGEGTCRGVGSTRATIVFAMPSGKAIQTLAGTIGKVLGLVTTRATIDTIGKLIVVVAIIIVGNPNLTRSTHPLFIALFALTGPQNLHGRRTIAHGTVLVIIVTLRAMAIVAKNSNTKRACQPR